MANDSDQMCLDCHRSWNTADHAKGTHPVGIDYQQKASAKPSAFNAVPVNANPSNPTSAMKLLDGKVSCRTCHGVHATDSDSSTFDSFSSLPYLKPSDGTLLRTDLRAATADGINICTNCHSGKVAHNGRGQNIQCTDCHGAHVDAGDGSTPNVWLIKRDMGTDRGRVFFTSTSSRNYMSADNSGVCQSCHAVPTGTGFQFHMTQTNATCNDCHVHGSSKSSFSVNVNSTCTACHGYPPMANIAGSGGYAAGYVNAPSFTDESNSGHASHASSPYQKACFNCHQGNSHQKGTFQDVFIDTTGTVAATGGLAPVYDTAGQTCSNVYCHSNANPRGGTNITRTTPSWTGGKGKIIGTSGECGSCHSAAGDPSPTWSLSHSRHINGYAANPNFTCTACHAKTASGNSAIFNTMSARSMHTNGQKDVAFNSFAGGGAWDQISATCTNLYCHSNVQGSAGMGAPDSYTSGLAWNGAPMTCGSCHAPMIKMGNLSTATGSHRRHVQVYAYDCSTCHGTGYSAAGGTVPVATHVDGVITMDLTGTASTNGARPAYSQGNNTPGDGYKNCANIYCHSNVQGNGGVGLPVTFAAPVWGGAPLPCGSCHANMATSAAATGSHVQHAQTAGYGCIICHNGAGKDPNPPFTATAKHADGTIEISFSGNGAGTAYSKGEAIIPGSGYGSCSASKCHGSGTPTWGTPLWSATDQCGKCHSSGAAGAVTEGTPFYSTSYPTKVTANTDAKAGAHTAHLTGPEGLANAFACADCHGSVALGAATHMDGVTNFTWSSLATKSGILAPTYTAATGRCANVYCHGGSMPGGDTSGTNRTPTWNAPFLPKTLSAAGCGTCHGFPPSTASGHPSVSIPGGFPATASIGTTCSCHGNINPAGNSYANIFVNKALHIDGSLQVSGGHTFPYPGTAHMNAAGTAPWSACAGCHSTAAGGTYPVAAGTAPACTGCHIQGLKAPVGSSSCWDCHGASATSGLPNGSAFPNNNRSHSAHVSVAGTSCNICHNGGGSGSATHASSNRAAATQASVKVAFNSQAGPSALWTSATITCSTTYCHGSGAPVWGTPLWSTTDQCGKCHSSSAAGAITGSVPFYSTSYPTKVTANTDAKAGAHTSHLTASDGLTNAFVCADCHGSVTLTAGTHMNGVTDFAWSPLATKNGALTPTYTAANGRCANVYCHGASMLFGDTSGTNRTPTWNVPFLPATLSAAACGSCHGFPPSAASGHPAVTIPAGFPATATLGTTCSCHPNINTTGNSYATIFVNKTLHINGVLDVSGGGTCDSCHGYPPARAGFAGTHGNWSSARTEDYVGGGGAHTIDNHVDMQAKPGEGFANCSKCHNAADHQMSPITFNPSRNIRVNVSQRYRFEAARQFKYSSNRLDAGSHLTGTCSNGSCHFGATPKWDPSH